MNLDADILETLKSMGVKKVLWRTFIWVTIIALIVSPIAIYLV